MNRLTRRLTGNSGLVIDCQDMRGAGQLKELQLTAETEDRIGTDVIAVPPGSAIELDLRVESVVEGVLVTGTASAQVVGECVRCLTGISDRLVVDVQELYFHPDRLPADPAEAAEVSVLSGDQLDLEPVVTDQMVLEMPLQPVCQPECRGLCAQCGASLNDTPEHQHETSGPLAAQLANWQFDPKQRRVPNGST